MICSNCQTENRLSARFCKTCGQLLLSSLDDAQRFAENEGAIDEHESTPPELISGDEEPVSALDIHEPSFEENGGDEDLLSEADDDNPDADEVQSTVDAQIGSQIADASTSDASTVVDSQEVLDASGHDDTDSVSTDLDKSQEVESIPELQPLALETVVMKRFEIVEVLQETEQINVYRVRDWGVCPACRYEIIPPGEEYCPECGVALDQLETAIERDLQEAHSPEEIFALPEDGFVDSGRFYLLPPLPDLVAEAETESIMTRGLGLAIGYASDEGMEREIDEDSLCVCVFSGVYESVADPTLGLFIIADGMGGHEGGEIASRLAVQIVAKRLIEDVLIGQFVGEHTPLPETVRKRIGDAVAEANDRIHALAVERANEMGCTLTLALVMDGKAYIANVGDSRTYVFGEDGLQQITTDHSVVASLVTSGMIEPDDVYLHPERNIIYRSLGTTPDVDVDIFEVGLVPDTALLLCCDGLWEMLRNEGIEDVLLSHIEPQEVCRQMVRRANMAGGEDNISVILVKTYPLATQEMLR